MRAAAVLLCLALLGAAKPKAPLTPPPLVRMVAPPPGIQTVETPDNIKYFEKWRAKDYGSYAEAWTANDSGSLFGALCGKTCVYYLNIGRTCVHGDRYPAMINSPAGSYAIELKCYTEKGSKIYFLTFPLTTNSYDILTKGGEIGFAVPLESGQFAVSRFSLSGGLTAVRAVVADALAKRNESQEGLRDFTI